MKEEARDSSLDPSDTPSQSPDTADMRSHFSSTPLQAKPSSHLTQLDKRSVSHAHDSSPGSVSVPSPTQCQYAGLGTPFSQSCALGGGAGDGQVYYPHHGGVGRMSSFLPVSTSSMGGALLQSSMAPLHSSSASGRLTGQTPGGLSDCSGVRQHAGLSPPSSYGGLRGGMNQSTHPSLSSCTYVQSPQQYAAQLTTSMHMMNMNFSGPMA